MKRVTVLVLDGDKRQALAACRALGALGHVVGAAGHPPAALAGWSRHTRQYHQIPDSRGPTAPFIEAVESLIREHGYEVVIALEDPTVAQLSLLSLKTPTSPEVGPWLDRLVDKVNLVEVAVEANVAYPRTATWPREGLENHPHLPELPVFVKAARSAAIRGGAVRHDSGARPATDWAAVEELATAIRERGLTPIVQERIMRSDKINVTIFRRGGRSEVRFPYRVIRDIPLTGGLAVTLETISDVTGVGAEAVAALERVCDAAGYEGVANGEFCVAKNDGRLVLIEVNTRLWGSLWFAERLGQRVTERSVAHALRLASEPAQPSIPGKRFHNTAGELRWILLHPQRRRPVVDVLRSMRPWDVYDYVDLGDPGATLRYGLAKLRGDFR